MPKRKKKVEEEPVVFSEDAETLIEVVQESKDEECQKKMSELKMALKELYDNRPIYIGREYNVLHKWYKQLEALTV